MATWLRRLGLIVYVIVYALSLWQAARYTPRWWGEALVLCVFINAGMVVLALRERRG